MKKYMIPALALVLFTGIANAQAQKQPTKPKTNTESVQTKKSVAKSTTGATASVSPQSTQEKSATPAITRKHHHKSSKVARKVTK